MVALNPDGTAIGTPVGGATSANQTNGTQKTQIVDAGGEAVTVTGGKLDVNATVNASIDTTGLATDTLQTTGNAILTTIDGDTGAVAAGYAAEGAALGSGVLLQADDGTDRINVLADTSGHLQVDVLTLPAGGSGLTDSELRATPVPVSGTVTSNAGTNLNTSLLALEAGNLASIKAKTDNIPAQGQALAAASLPVVLTAAQITTLTPPAAITGFGTAANQATIIGHVDGIETSLTSIDGKITAVNTGAVVVSSSALPTGASTAAKQPALGTAGTASADVITVQGIASMTALKVDGSAVTQPVSGTFWQATQPVSLASAPTTTVTATDLDIRPLANTDVVTAELSAVDNAVLDTIAAKDFATQTTLAAMNAKLVTGTVIGDVNLGATDNAVLDAIEADTTIIAGAIAATHMQADIVGALPAGTAVIGKTGIDQTTPGTTNLVALSAETTKVIGTVRVASGGIASGAIASGAIASGAIASGAIAAGAIAAGNTSIATTEDTASAAGEHLLKNGIVRYDTPVSGANTSGSADWMPPIADSFGKAWVTGSVPEDTAHIDLEAITTNGSRRIDTLATSAGTSGDWATVNQTAEGGAWSTLAPTTTSGLSTFMASGSDGSSILVATAQVIKATAGNLYGYYLYNPEAAVTFVHFYNTAAASVTVGTTSPLFTLQVPAGSAANLMMPYPVAFTNAGWSIAATTTAGGNTAPATGVSATIWYK